IKFSFASVRKSPMGNCEPVRITGLFTFFNIKLKADAVYDIVSEPCNRTKPSKPLKLDSITLANVIHRVGFISEESFGFSYAYVLISQSNRYNWVIFINNL